MQGWRLEVKQFPKLTEFGAWRGPKGRQYGGFYTQQEVTHPPPKVAIKAVLSLLFGICTKEGGLRITCSE